MSYAQHQHTPTLSAIDPRGLPVRGVAYHRETARERPQPRITRRVFGAQGALHEQWDSRLIALQAADPAVKPNERVQLSLSGMLLRIDRVDAGWQLRLPGAAGQLLEQWDARGAHQRYEYDRLLRTVATFEHAADQPAPRCVERLTYSHGTATQGGLHAGRLVRHDDTAGTLFYEAYGVQGQVVRQSRAFAQQPQMLDWPESPTAREPLLEAQRFVTTWHYAASGQLLEQVDAKGNRAQSRYGLEGQLMSGAVLLAGGRRQVLVERCTYNAAGQLLSERAGNGVVTSADYAEADNRLQRLRVHRAGGQNPSLQVLNYEYDGVGNVVRIQDAVQPTRWFNNAHSAADAVYAYDTAYQLIRATGREHAHALAGQGPAPMVLFGAVDDSQWRAYTQQYSYDASGNLKTVQHRPAVGTGYTRDFTVGRYSNHACLQPTAVDAPGLGRGFDACGNQLELVQGQAMSWNVRNQLTRVTQVRRGQDADDDDETYGYDGGGQRVFKRRRSRGRMRTFVQEVRYLPGLEIRSNTATGEQLNVITASLGRSPARILQWEAGQPEGLANEQVRFSIGDHLASRSLELDGQAQLISQEVFYPFGGTAWWAARNAVEANYKTLRYSAKERDASGLYYYGARYYAPWLQRWISPDPAGAVDGLNLYAMVGNNPVTFVDRDGLQGQRAAPVSPLALTAVAVLMMLLGVIGGALMGHEMAGASIGALVGAAVVYRHQRRPRTEPAQMTDSQYGEQLTSLALRMAEHYRLSNEEASRLLSLAYEQRREVEGVSFLVSYEQDLIYAHAGPFAAKPQAEALIAQHRNPAPELARIGWDTRQLRGPTRSQTLENVQASSAPSFEVASTSHASRARRQRRSAVAEAHTPVQQSQAVTASGFEIDTTAVQGIDPLSTQGRSIALALSHLREARFTAVHWHQHRDRLWSVDLHGYPGARGRGAYRLMLQHMGGLHYRVQGVRDPHRR